MNRVHIKLPIIRLLFCHLCFSVQKTGPCLKREINVKTFLKDKRNALITLFLKNGISPLNGGTVDIKYKGELPNIERIENCHQSSFPNNGLVHSEKI